MTRMQHGETEAVSFADVSKVGYPWISNLGHSPGTNPPPFSSPTNAAPDPSARKRRCVRIGRWGNVLAIRLPQALSKLLCVQLGDELELSLLSSGQLLLTAMPRRSRLALCAFLSKSIQER
mgnify:CR=1 FL=1